MRADVDLACTWCATPRAAVRFAQIDPNTMIRIVPNLVVEVLSPSTDLYDLSTKRRLYEQLGVSHYWITDAQANAVRECVLGADGQYAARLVTAGEPFEPALFPDLQIDLQRDPFEQIDDSVQRAMLVIG